MITYDVGDRIPQSVAFTIDDVAADPTVLTCQVRKPDGTETTYTYVTDPEIVKDSTGTYHINIDAVQSGRYSGVWTGTGTAIGSERWEFAVRNPVLSQ